MLTISIPLSGKLQSQRIYISISNDSGDGINTQNGLSGFTSEKTSYTMQAGYTSNGRGATDGASITHGTNAGQLSANISIAWDYQSASMNVMGAVVVYGSGVNLNHTVGDTFALIRMEDLKDTDIRTDGGIPVDRNGYAVATYAQPYRLSALRPGMRNLDVDVGLEDTVKQAVSRRGAIVQAIFRGYNGRRAQFTLQ